VSARKAAKRVAERPADGGYEIDDEQEVEEPRSRGAVQPIRDVADELVFRFEIGPAILAQLLQKLERLATMPLSEALDAKYPGFYQIFIDGAPKYIGKTARPVGARLKEHAKKLRGRKGINFANVTCRYAFVEDPSLVDVAEGALIDFFAARGLADWNTTGFGSKVSGHRRGDQEASDWATLFPSDLDVLISVDGVMPMSLDSIVRQVASRAPITLSVPTKLREAFQQDHNAVVGTGSTERSFSEWIVMIESQLAAAWQIDRKAESWYIVRAE
jgi:hypothetical protein